MSELPQETGDERVDAIVADLGRLGELPVGAHVAVFEEAFSGLEGTLAAVDEAAPHERAGDRPAGQVGQGVVGLVGGQVPNQADGRAAGRMGDQPVGFR
ncbi:hypothetical protein GCM10022224_064390 [Nonomuraea antimicrobica]|uniref:Uncharacterized protein n=1 Tax=Nonomuraea antimicrobica TaxID=561173 RepID=A0ABP7CKQ6_9ACTN